MQPSHVPVDEPKPRARRRTLIVGALVVLGLVIAGTAVALSLTNLSTQYISLFNAPTASSHFTVSSYDTKVKGHDTVDVSVTVANSDTAAAHTANVYIQLVDSTGAQIANATVATGTVAASSSGSVYHSFSGTNYAVNYDHTFLSIHDTS